MESITFHTAYWIVDTQIYVFEKAGTEEESGSSDKEADWHAAPVPVLPNQLFLQTKLWLVKSKLMQQNVTQVSIFMTFFKRNQNEMKKNE